MIYAESRGDIIPKIWSAAEFDSQFEILIDQKPYVGITEEGNFVRLSLFEKVRELVKGFFGGTNLSNEKRVHAAWLKFLYYGETHQFLTDSHLNRLRYRITNSSLKKSFINNLFKELDDFHSYHKNQATSEHFSKLRDLISIYHRRYASSLQPGFWIRLVYPPNLNLVKLSYFGDAPLQLSKKARLSPNSDPFLAFEYLRKAFAVKNDTPEFQARLAKQLFYLETSFSTELRDQSRAIQKLWIELAENSFEENCPEQSKIYLERALKAHISFKGRLAVGKLYLKHEEYELALPFLSELKKSYPNDAVIQTQIGFAYEKNDKAFKALEVYENALTLYQLETNDATKQTEMAKICFRIATIYLNDLTFPVPSKLINAKSYLSEAVNYDSSTLEYQVGLCKVFEELFQTNLDNFAATNGQEFLKFIRIFDKDLIKLWEHSISLILITCSEQFFNNHQNQDAHNYLQESFFLFPTNSNLKIQALEMALRHQDVNPLMTHLQIWESEKTHNPRLKKTIGDALWQASKDKALKAYETSLELFSKQLSICLIDQDKINIQNAMAEILAKIGQSHLNEKPGLFKSIPYEEALQRLEKAATLNSSHASLLFDAYLAAAHAESQRNILMRDTRKIIKFYTKAFETLNQKGEYLIELFQLCLDAKQFDDAIVLYYAIQKQPWSQEFCLSASIYYKLAEKLNENKDHQSALDCFKQAYSKESHNQKYKQAYFQFNLKLSADVFNKMQEEILFHENQRISALTSLADQLKECWNQNFITVEHLKASYQELLASIYESLARTLLQKCLIPQSADQFDKIDLKKHRKEKEREIKQVLNYYTEGLEIHPSCASLHFDKGLVLEYWLVEFEAALKEYELASKLQPRNPYYYWLLSQAYFASDCNQEKMAEFKELSDKYSYEGFKEDRIIFNKEMLFNVKTKHIDPHTYTQKSTWF